MKQNTSLFLKSFAITLVLLLVICGILIFVFRQDGLFGQNDQTNSEAQVPVWTPEEDEIMNILFMGCSKRNEPADLFVLLKFNPINQEISITTIPSSAEATVNSKAMNLTEHYDYGGIRTAVSAVQNMFDIPVNRYVRMDDEAFEKMVDLMGGLEYDVQKPIVYKNESTDVTTTIPAGKQTIDGRRLVALIRYQNEEINTINRANKISDILCEFLNQRINSSYSPAYSLYESMVNDIDTNFSNSDYTYRLESFQNMIKLDKTLFTAIPLTGELDEEQQFDPDAPAKEQVKSVFGAVSDVAG